MGMNLSPKQIEMLKECRDDPNGQVITSGFHRSPNVQARFSTKTALSLRDRGLLRFKGYPSNRELRIFEITEYGLKELTGR